MAKVLGKIEKEEVDRINKFQIEIDKTKNQIEFFSLKSENLALKKALMEKEKDILFLKIKNKFNIDDLSLIRIKDSGEIIDVSDEVNKT